MDAKFYSVTYNGHTFHASLTEHDTNWYEILLGGSLKKCVIIHIYPKDRYCSLIHVHHDKSCNLAHDLGVKSGTRDMIAAGIHLCKGLFPSVAYMTLQDESVIKCGHGVHLPLGDVYMLLYGKTWYQTYCDAQPMNPESLTHLTKTLSHPPEMEWKKLWGTYLAHGFAADNEDQIHKEYRMASSWHAFFQQIRDGNCKTWVKWIGLLMKALARGFTIAGSMWKIDMIKTKMTANITEIEKPAKEIPRPRYSGRRLFGGRNRNKK